MLQYIYQKKERGISACTINLIANLFYLENKPIGLVCTFITFYQFEQGAFLLFRSYQTSPSKNFGRIFLYLILSIKVISSC